MPGHDPKAPPGSPRHPSGADPFRFSGPLGLGRVPAPDNRDRAFPMSTVVAEAGEDPGTTWRYWNPSAWWGDQGRTPHCVAYSWIHFVEDGPITRPSTPHGGDDPIVDPRTLYDECQRNDTWPGEDYDGTSVRAGAKVLQRRGFIGEYRWAWDAGTVVDALLRVGPVVVGSWWYRDMFYPDEEGNLSVSGERAGGHAYVLNGVNTERGIVRVKNSWGRGWGKDGYGYLRIEDLDRLLSEQGEACLATERGGR